jgi:uncharacterized pyridoxal phosphate-containing UPF0001 family protein
MNFQECGKDYKLNNARLYKSKISMVEIITIHTVHILKRNKSARLISSCKIISGINTCHLAESISAMKKKDAPNSIRNERRLIINTIIKLLYIIYPFLF